MTATPDLTELLDTLEAAALRKRFRRYDFFIPYPKQQQFFDLGANVKERLLSAGNQNGKTYAGGYETAIHLTGEYPDWWLGRRWDRPIIAWACGESGLVVRDVQQSLLCGTPGVEDEQGTGMIPRDLWVGKPSSARGVADAYDTVAVRHTSGGISTLSFKSYEQGRGKFQGKGVDFEWWDEEPPDDVYQEGMARLIATGGCAEMTFTPLKGMTGVVTRFFSEKSDNRALVMMTIDDALHIPAAERAKRIADMRPHEREARAYGVPMLGEGRVFQSAEETLIEPAIGFDNIPMHWAKLWAVDFGIAHPFAAVLIAWDKDTDIIHVLHTIRFSDGTAVDHTRAINAVAAGVPVAWPHDGEIREKGTGEQIAVLYRHEGLPMLDTFATHDDGGYGVEVGIMEMDTRMRTGRFKVAEHLGQWREEYRGYYRKNGLIVKERDDIMSATRYGVMMRRYAKSGPLGPKLGYDHRRRDGQGNSYMAEGLDFDLFTGA